MTKAEAAVARVRARVAAKVFMSLLSLVFCLLLVLRCMRMLELL